MIDAHGAPLHCYPAANLDRIDVPHPNEPVRGHVYTRSVAEAAALLAARDLGGDRWSCPSCATNTSPSRWRRCIPGGSTVDQFGVHGLRGMPAHLPEHALRPAPGRCVIASRCTSCGTRVEICPVDAITLRD